jgi:hypothetical protein
MPIDTFNITGDRRKSLVKQVNEANANSNAMIALNYGKSGESASIPKTPDENKQMNCVLPVIQNVQKGQTEPHLNLASIDK